MTHGLVAAECADVNLDEIAAREQTMVQDLAALRERLMETRDVLAEARRAFEDIGGSHRAARAAADRQSALSELQQIAEDYVSVRTGVGFFNGPSSVTGGKSRLRF